MEFDTWDSQTAKGFLKNMNSEFKGEVQVIEDMQEKKSGSRLRLEDRYERLAAHRLGRDIKGDGH